MEFNAIERLKFLVHLEPNALINSSKSDLVQIRHLLGPSEHPKTPLRFRVATEDEVITDKWMSRRSRLVRRIDEGFCR